MEAVNDYAIFALDKEGFIRTWNAGAKRLKGYSAQEIIGSHFSKFYTKPDIDRQHPQAELTQAVSEGRYEEEGWRVKKDGSQFWANVVITPLRDTKGELQGFAKVTRDLTERKTAQDKLHHAYEELEQRVEQRTAELAKARDEAEIAVKTRDEFLSIASHELKTPLTSLKLQIQMRRRNIQKGAFSALTPERFMAMVDDDEKQINRINRLVDDMLDISRLRVGKFILEPTEFDLGELVKEVVQRFLPQLEAAECSIHLNIPLPVLGTWDHARIEQVFTNLLTNAMKYGAGNPIEIGVYKNETEATISVRDEGIGIAENDFERVFQQFERAVHPNEVSGLGLGLYIVKEIIHAHTGKISVQSQLKRGSTFTVKLPLHSATK